ncbi:MAG TPA: peptidase inhibitor family I36 protein [Vicinamibacterales bacterium]|nr:peptidase inhibitor family I36 protein [Vicinamibacterales bacterium]
MRKTSIALATLAALALPATAMAQRWGRERFPQSGACFFRDADYRGDYFCIRSGDDVRLVPEDMNDRISSIRVFGRAAVVVFRDARFSGGSARFVSNVRDLRDEGWNDRVSSLQVREDRGDREAGRDRDAERGRAGERAGGRPTRGPDVDAIVRRAYQDVLGRDPDEGGLRQYRSRIIDNGWTEAQVRDSLRNSPEYREKTTMTFAKAQDIVRRAYLNVLKREPDAVGSQGYIANVMRNNWSQADVERELMKSQEYRDKNR